MLNDPVNEHKKYTMYIHNIKRTNNKEQVPEQRTYKKVLPVSGPVVRWWRIECIDGGKKSLTRWSGRRQPNSFRI